MKKYMTFVFEITDEIAFAEEKRRLLSQMFLDDSAPYQLSGVAAGDAIHHLRIVTKALVSDEIEAAKSIAKEQNVHGRALQDFIYPMITIKS